MSRKLALLLIYVTILVGIFVPATVSSEILVGVKAGDRVEYEVHYYAIDEPPAEPLPIWCEVEVLSVQRTNVTYALTEKASDNTTRTNTFTEDIETGVSEAWIIPANLSNTDVFGHEDYGFIMISGVAEANYAGANRTVVKATVSNMNFIWDKSTGVLVELAFLNEYLGAYMDVIIVDTNMWQTEFLLPIDPTTLSILIIVAVVIVVAVLFFVIRRRKIGKRKKREIKRKKKRKK